MPTRSRQKGDLCLRGVVAGRYRDAWRRVRTNRLRNRGRSAKDVWTESRRTCGPDRRWKGLPMANRNPKWRVHQKPPKRLAPKAARNPGRIPSRTRYTMGVHRAGGQPCKTVQHLRGRCNGPVFGSDRLSDRTSDRTSGWPSDWPSDWPSAPEPVAFPGAFQSPIRAADPTAIPMQLPPHFRTNFRTKKSRSTTPDFAHGHCESAGHHVCPASSCVRVRQC